MIIAISITLFFLILRFSVTVFNFISNPKLTRVNRRYDDFVSILIPARNEEGNILTLLQSIHQQDHQNYEVIVYDDDSTDDTYTRCLEFAAKHSRFSVIKGDGPPPGWLGKNYACHQLSRQARGNYFLFLDADDIVHKNLVNSALYRMHFYKLALLSLVPNQVMQTFGEKAIVPLVHYVILNMLPLRLIFLAKSSYAAAACGQFMLFDAAIYRQCEWHRQVKNKVVEDAAIMRQVKTHAYNGEFLLANGMISCRMYKSYAQGIDGFCKSFMAAFNYSIPAVILYILLIIGGPMVIIMTFDYSLIFYMTGLIILTRTMISLSSGQNALYNIVLHPVQMMNMMIISFLSIHRYLTKTVMWKGRRV